MSPNRTSRKEVRLGRTEMSQEELKKVEVLARVQGGGLRVKDAAALLGLSYRQAKRLWKRYRQEGAAGMRHGSAGRRSNRAYPANLRNEVLEQVREKYSGEVGERFGPTLAAEHLAGEDGLQVGAETLRRWMLAEGLWTRERRGWRHRRRRERKEHFGELVQMDGSFHAWLEERGPRGCLMDLVDDATNTTWAQLGEEETLWAAADALRAWVEHYGVPRALYVDWKNLYQRSATRREQLRGEEPITQFGRLCARLGIQLIGASSPQAKGRVERMHGTHQDRLVKKLRRLQIATQAEANAYLEKEYLAEHNQRFARPAARSEDYHRPCPGEGELDRIFRLQTERVIGGDWVVRYHGRLLQLEPGSRHYAPARSQVVVWEGREGELSIDYRGREIAWSEIRGSEAEATCPPPEPATTIRPTLPEAKPRWVPGDGHPWRDTRWRRETRAAEARAAQQASLTLPSAGP